MILEHLNEKKMGFIIQLGYFILSASQYLLFKTNIFLTKNLFLLDCKKPLNTLLLDRILEKPHGQTSCPVAGLVKGKFEFYTSIMSD